ncbi:MAG: cytochrome c, partial [Candidatus Omnitrophica bacterium]|nr:cytochrome c [Candidatus Omnitrophota bacterium]
QLFRGQKPLANGGMSCIGCHRFEGEGGSLGPDLTLLYERSSGIVLQSSIEQSSFKIMRPIYEKHKITAEEALHLSEYLSHPEKVNQRFAPTLNIIVLLSTVGFGGFFVWLWIMNKQRKGPTRERLIRKYESG